MLTIAHRLNTVMDSDRIMVMEQGQVSTMAVIEYIEFSHVLKLQPEVFQSINVSMLFFFQIVEFGKPAALLANKDSLFSSLVAAAEKSN